MRKMLVLFFSTIFFIIAAGGCSTEESESNETIHWDFTEYVSLEHPNGEAALEFAEKVYEKSDGRLDITVRGGGELPYEQNQFLRATAGNNVQMANVGTSTHSGELPVGALANLPYLITNLDELNKAMEIMRPYIEEQLEERNTKLLYYYPWPPQNFFGSDTIISDHTDMSGDTVRAVAPEETYLFNALGITPVSIATPEVPQAIQRGMADGVATSASTVVGSGWYDFIDWGYRMDTALQLSFIVVNQDEYNALPEDLQSVVDEVAAELQKDLPQRAMDMDDEYLEMLQNEYGVEIREAPEEEIEELTSLSKDIWPEWAEEHGPIAKEALKKVREELNK